MYNRLEPFLIIFSYMSLEDVLRIPANNIMLYGFQRALIQLINNCQYCNYGAFEDIKNAKITTKHNKIEVFYKEVVYVLDINRGASVEIITLDTNHFNLMFDKCVTLNSNRQQKFVQNLFVTPGSDNILRPIILQRHTDKYVTKHNPSMNHILYCFRNGIGCTNSLVVVIDTKLNAIIASVCVRFTRSRIPYGGDILVLQQLIGYDATGFIMEACG